MAGTSLLPSPLRPHVCAADRLRLWTPINGRAPLNAAGKGVTLLEDDLAHTLDVAIRGYTKATRETYGSGLLLFHEFCDRRRLPELSRTPISQSLLEVFATSLVGTYSRSVVENAVAAVRAWHSVHGVPWVVNADGLKAVYRAARLEAPLCRPPREPIRPELIERIAHTLDWKSPKDVAFFACLTTTFYATARLGEFVIPTVNGFDSCAHITPAHVSRKYDPQQSCWVMNFALPRTKVSEVGESVMWAPQDGASDPHAALDRHMEANRPPPNGPLFAYREGRGHTPMTRSRFLDQLRVACTQLGVTAPHGHSLRIGGTLELLLRGLSFELVKAKGRWKGDSFQGYLREHSAVLAPYLQASPLVDADVRRYALPSIR